MHPICRWYLTPQHAAECTAGYYNTNNNNAYLNIAQMFAKHNAGFDFTYVSGRGRRGEGVSCSWQLTLFDAHASCSIKWRTTPLCAHPTGALR